MRLRPTADPEVVIEAQGDDWIIYRRSDGVRWRVSGRCDKRGDCVLGAVVTSPAGEPVLIKSKRQLNRLAKEWNRPGRIDGPLDIPTGPGYGGECCPLKVDILA
jgi:hypothetical protein